MDGPYVSTLDLVQDTSTEDDGPTGSQTSALPPGNQMFAHSSHLNFWESVFAIGPVNVTYAAERNTEEILKVSFRMSRKVNKSHSTPGTCSEDHGSFTQSLL